MVLFLNTSEVNNDVCLTDTIPASLLFYIDFLCDFDLKKRKRFLEILRWTIAVYIVDKCVRVHLTKMWFGTSLKKDIPKVCKTNKRVW